MEKTKTNKKSKSVIALLVAVLLCVAIVLGMGGFTYAKYISGKSVESQTASVAKWGWQISADATKMFGTSYEASTGAVITGSDSSSTVGVKASSNAVAPNTNGSMTFSITGSAEVRSQITVTADGTPVTLKWKDSSDSEEQTYEPIVWTLKSGTAEGTYSTTLAENKSLFDIITELGKLSTNAIDAGGEEQTLYYELSWAWAFQTEKTEGSDDSSGTTYYDLEDTILGAVANGKDSLTSDGKVIDVSDKTATVGDVTYTAVTELTFSLSITVEQIQGDDDTASD